MRGGDSGEGPLTPMSQLPRASAERETTALCRLAFIRQCFLAPKSHLKLMWGNMLVQNDLQWKYDQCIINARVMPGQFYLLLCSLKVLIRQRKKREGQGEGGKTEGRERERGQVKGKVGEKRERLAFFFFFF